jgi:pSer/pThr/pTyr-binding forkhead associated (FHA) protein
MPEYSFIVTDGPDLGRTFTLEEGATLIGRGEFSMPEDPPGSRRWTLIDKTVSRTHARLDLADPGAPLLTHLSQTNDTYVDDRKIFEETLQPGQTVRLGQTTLEVQMESGWVRKAY